MMCKRPECQVYHLNMKLYHVWQSTASGLPHKLTFRYVNEYLQKSWSLLLLLEKCVYFTEWNVQMELYLSLKETAECLLNIFFNFLNIATLGRHFFQNLLYKSWHWNWQAVEILLAWKRLRNCFYCQYFFNIKSKIW